MNMKILPVNYQDKECLLRKTSKLRVKHLLEFIAMLWKVISQ